MKSATERRRHRLPESSGFTLLEVLVAMLVLALAFVTLLGLHGRNIKVIAVNRDLTRATLLGRSLLTQIQTQVLTDGLDSLSSGAGAFPDYPGYRWEVDVSETELEDVRRVVLRVVWDERNPNGAELLYYIRGTAS
jgi:general secretion pathway protein I